MVDEFGLTMIDGTKSVKEQQKKVRAIIKKILVGFEGLPNPNKMPITMTNIQAGKHKKGGSK